MTALNGYLTVCNDYVRDGWANGARYRFRWNMEEFAFVDDTSNPPVVWVNPKFLA